MLDHRSEAASATTSDDQLDATVRAAGTESPPLGGRQNWLPAPHVRRWCGQAACAWVIFRFSPGRALSIPSMKEARP